jgi:hypothetical protein
MEDPMTRNIKTMLLVGMAIAASGGLSASAAQASFEQFHCSVAPCTVTIGHDGANKVAHHVFDFKVNSGNLTTVTCSGMTADATSNTATTTELTLTLISWSACNVGGQLATIDVNGCHLLFTAGTDGEDHVQCPSEKSIQLTFGTCTVSIGTQKLKGMKYHNVGTEITAETLVTGVHGTTSAGCPGGAGTFTTGEYTTGNVIVTGETHQGQMATISYS